MFCVFEKQMNWLQQGGVNVRQAKAVIPMGKPDV